MGADYKDCVERKHMDGKQEYLHEIQKSFLPAGIKDGLNLKSTVKSVIDTLS